jgi:hypothetical protein
MFFAPDGSCCRTALFIFAGWILVGGRRGVWVVAVQLTSFSSLCAPSPKRGGAFDSFPGRLQEDSIVALVVGLISWKLL